MITVVARTRIAAAPRRRERERGGYAQRGKDATQRCRWRDLD